MPARLFFRQAIRVGAGERLDQRALAVIDVAGGGDDEVRARRTSTGVTRPTTARSALITSASCCGKIVRRSSLRVPRRDVADHRHRLLAQAGGEFLRAERGVRQIERHRGHAPIAAACRRRSARGRCRSRATSGSPSSAATIRSARPRRSSLVTCIISRTGIARIAAQVAHQRWLRAPTESACRSAARGTAARA